MRWLAVRSLRHQPTSFLAAFLALFGGSLVVIAALVLLDTGIRSPAPDQAAAGVDAMVIGQSPPGTEPDEDLPRPLEAFVSRIDELFEPGYQPADRTGTVPERLAADLRTVDGVASVVPEVRFPAAVSGPDHELVPGVTGPSEGRGWDSAGIDGWQLASGRPPRGDGEVVIDRDLAARAGVGTGDLTRVLALGEAATYEVVGIVVGPGGAAPARSTLLFSEAHARQLRGAPDGVVDRLGVAYAPDAEVRQVTAALQAAAGDHEVLTGRRLDAMAWPAWAEGRSTLQLIGASFLGLVLIVVGVVTASTINVALQRRQREVALLRTIAVTPQQARRLIGWEATLVSLAAGAIAVPLAYPLGGWTVARMEELGVLPTALEPARGPWPAIVGIAAVTAMARLAGAAAARKPTKGSPIRAATAVAGRPRLPGPWRTATGGALVVLGVAALVVPAILAGPAAGMAGAATATLVLIVAAGLLGPWIVHAVACGVAPLAARSRSPAPALAVAGVRFRLSQVALIGTTVVLAGALATVGVGVQYQQVAAASSQIVDGTRADHLITSSGAGIPAVAVEELAALPPVDHATPVSTRPLLHEYHEFGLASEGPYSEITSTLVVGPDGMDAVLDLGGADVGVAALGPDTVVVGRERATFAGLGVGDTTRVVLPDATARDLEVVGIHDRDLAFGELVVSRELLDGDLPSALVDTVYVTLHRDADEADLQAALAELAPRYPGLHLQVPADTVDDATPGFLSELWLNLLLLSALCGLAYLAVLNTVTAGTAHRRREFALLRIAGVHASQLVRQSRWESAIVGFITLATAGAIAGTALVALQVALTGSIVPQVPPLLVVGFLGLPVLAVAVTTEVVTRSALRHAPVQALAGER